MEAMAWPSHTWVMGCFLEEPICFASHQNFGYLVVINQISTSFPPKYLVTSRVSFQEIPWETSATPTATSAETTPFARRLDEYLKSSEMDKTMEKPPKEGTEHFTECWEGNIIQWQWSLIWYYYIYVSTYMDWYGFIIWIGLIWINRDQYGWIFHGWSNFFGAVEGILP